MAHWECFWSYTESLEDCEEDASTSFCSDNFAQIKVCFLGILCPPFCFMCQLESTLLLASSHIHGCMKLPMYVHVCMCVYASFTHLNTNGLPILNMNRTPNPPTNELWASLSEGTLEGKQRLFSLPVINLFRPM